MLLNLILLQGIALVYFKFKKKYFFILTTKKTYLHVCMRGYAPLLVAFLAS